MRGRALLIASVSFAAVALGGLVHETAAQQQQGTQTGQAQQGAQQVQPEGGMMGGPTMGPMMGGGMMRGGMMGGGDMMGRQHHGAAGSGIMMRIMFSLMDADGDGSISLQEFQAAHERIFKAIDQNKDGRLTMEEVQSFIGRGVAR